MERFAIHRQAAVLVAICMFDLVSTVWIVHTGRGDEANPLMAFFLAQGVIVFIAAKLCMVAAPVATLEWARPKRPQFVKRAYYAAFIGYLGLYITGVSRANHPQEPHSVRVAVDTQRKEVWRRIQERIEAKKPFTPPPVRSKWSKEGIRPTLRHVMAIPVDDQAPATLPRVVAMQKQQTLPVAVPKAQPDDLSEAPALPIVAELPRTAIAIAN